MSSPPRRARAVTGALGRGHGSGRVKTSGRGTKGQNARSGGGTKPWFEGDPNPWTMRIPHKRGFSRARFQVVAQVVNLRDLEGTFANGDVVNEVALRQRGWIRDVSKRHAVMLLGDGGLTKRLTIAVPRASAGARAAVEEAGGTLTVLEDMAGHPPEAPAAAPSAGLPAL